MQVSLPDRNPNQPAGLVYELYGLTYEEIALVEGKTKKNGNYLPG